MAGELNVPVVAEPVRVDRGREIVVAGRVRAALTGIDDEAARRVGARNRD